NFNNDAFDDVMVSHRRGGGVETAVVACASTGRTVARFSNNPARVLPCTPSAEQEARSFAGFRKTARPAMRFITQGELDSQSFQFGNVCSLLGLKRVQFLKFCRRILVLSPEDCDQGTLAGNFFSPQRHADFCLPNPFFQSRAVVHGECPLSPT